MQSSRLRVAAIIPALNEEETVGDVIQVLSNSEFIDEVIVVSDGSTDNTAKVARQAGATQVIELEESVGKGEAMRLGVSKTRAPVVAFLDADLIGLSDQHIEQLVFPVLYGARDMNIGLRDKGPVLSGLQKHLPLISGERAMKRQIIEGIHPKYLQGYMVETAMNHYCRKHNRPFETVTLKKLQIKRKYEKVGLLKGLVGYIEMAFQIIKAKIILRWARITNQL